MEKALEAYSAEKLEAVVAYAEKNGVREHGFFRIVSVMGILISKGRRAALLPLFRRGMDIACDALWKTDMTIPENKSVGIDFAVKEIVFAYTELEKCGLFPKDWLESRFNAVKYRGAKLCIYGENFEPSDKKYANRDGIYRAFVCSGEHIKFKAN